MGLCCVFVCGSVQVDVCMRICVYVHRLLLYILRLIISIRQTARIDFSPRIAFFGLQRADFWFPRTHFLAFFG